MPRLLKIQTEIINDDIRHFQIVPNDDPNQLTKFIAAQRQLDAAIRMFLSSEDELAVHTVAAAAYRILRDLKENQGKTELTDIASGIAFNIANKIVNGDLLDLPDGATGEFGEIILELVELIKSGDVQDGSEVSISFRDERGHWRDYNKVANFLKHADADAEAVLSTSKVCNVRLLEDACRCYAGLAGIVTSEMIAFLIWCNPENPALLPIVGDRGSELNAIDVVPRRKVCLGLIDYFKGSDADILY